MTTTEIEPTQKRDYDVATGGGPAGGLFSENDGEEYFDDEYADHDKKKPVDGLYVGTFDSPLVSDTGRLASVVVDPGATDTEDPNTEANSPQISVIRELCNQL